MKSPKPLSEAPFPAPVYAETVLAVNFEDAKRYFLEAFIEIHYAHTLMLARQAIISAADAAACLRGLAHLNRPEIVAAAYDGTCEDLFFYLEERLAACCGPDAAGRMHTARSRNDIDLTLYRMVLRREVLKIADALASVRWQLLQMAATHRDTIMPGYTHTQPAQPTTLGHYLMAAVEFLGRDFQRLKSAFATVNRSPLGACAITTTGFPIDRDYTARLLGFERLQLNSYGAIAAIDYLTEAVSAVAVAMVNLGKLVQDLLMWCTKEFGFLRLDEAYVQCSSMMPQKRNPVALEHTRILASKALGQAQAILTSVHNTPFADIVDGEDDLQPLVFSGFADAERALRLFAGVMTHAEVQRERLARLANDNFLTVTELADTLVRGENLSFRAAHHLVSEAVRNVGPVYSAERMVEEVEHLAPAVLGRPLSVSREDLRRSLDADNFVRIRAIPGGPAPEAVAAQIESARREQAAFGDWLEGKQQLLRHYPELIQEAVDALVK